MLGQAVQPHDTNLTHKNQHFLSNYYHYQINSFQQTIKTKIKKALIIFYLCFHIFVKLFLDAHHSLSLNNLLVAFHQNGYHVRLKLAKH